MRGEGVRNGGFEEWDEGVRTGEFEEWDELVGCCCYLYKHLVYFLHKSNHHLKSYIHFQDKD